MVDQEDWTNTTHDWAALVDEQHLSAVRAGVSHLVPGGLLQLICEVLAYADDEAVALTRLGHCLVELSEDGSVSVADDGRGTDTRVDEHGSPIRKPVMATKDLRFFDSRTPPALPEGSARRGMSVVAALSEWLVHTNRRVDGSWTQRYEYGIPVTDLMPVPDTSSTGTTVRFRVDDSLVDPSSVTAAALMEAARFAHIEVDVRHVSG